MLAAKNDYDIFRNSIVKTAYNDGDGYTTEIKRPTADSKPPLNPDAAIVA